MSIVFASLNHGKYLEVQTCFAQENIPIAFMGDIDLQLPPETGASFLENALIKARYAARELNASVLADDSGLVVPALGGQPGVHSSRYAGEQASAEDNMTKLLGELGNTKDRYAYFLCVLVFLRSPEDPVPLVTQGVWEGSIAMEPIGSQGFGYDPIFRVSSHACSAAELSASEKSGISHRGKALRQMLVEIQSIIRKGEICQAK